MATPSSPLDLASWDAQMAQPHPEAARLYQKILAASQESPGNVELLWRLAQATYQVSLNCADKPAMTAKTREILAVAERALDLEMHHFQANLWMAVAAGTLFGSTLFGSSLGEADLNVRNKVMYTSAFQVAYDICVSQQPQHPMVLFMGGHRQLILAILPEEQETILRRYVSLPQIDLADGKAKYRAFLQLNPGFLQAYEGLATLLMVEERLIEAYVVVTNGLTKERTTQADERSAQGLVKLKEHLESSLPHPSAPATQQMDHN